MTNSAGSAVQVNCKSYSYCCSTVYACVITGNEHTLVPAACCIPQLLYSTGVQYLPHTTVNTNYIPGTSHWSGIYPDNMKNRCTTGCQGLFPNKICFREPGRPEVYIYTPTLGSCGVGQTRFDMTIRAAGPSRRVLNTCGTPAQR